MKLVDSRTMHRSILIELASLAMYALIDPHKQFLLVS